MTLKHHTSKVQFLLLVFAAMWIALGYDFIERTRSVPAVLRYIPRESSMVLYTEDIATVWKKLQPHYDRIVRRENHGKTQSLVYETINNIQSELKERTIPIEDLDSLTGYGIDTQRRVTFGWFAGEKRFRFVLVVPITDADMFAGFLARLSNEPKEDKPLHIGTASYKVSNYKDFYTHAPDMGHMIIASDRDVLTRALQDTSANLSFHRDDDILRSNQKALSSAIRQKGVSVVVSWRFTKNSWLQRAGMGISLSPNRMAVVLRAAVNTGVLNILDQIAAPPEGNGKIVDRIDSRTGIMVAIRDSALSNYIHFVKASGDSAIRDEIASFFGGVLLKLENMASITELTISVVGYNAGLPDVVMGLTGNRGEFEDMIYKIQRARRLERDEEILRKAMDESRPGQPVRNSELIGSLVKSGHLIETPRSLWHRYKISDGNVIENDLKQNDFGEQSGYVYESGQFRCVYLLPAVDENDIRFRLTPGELEEMDEETLRGNRYRLCSAIEDDVLWIGTDGENLNRFIRNTQSPETEKYHRTLAERVGTRGSKAHIFFDMNQIITEGLLNPESDINDALEKYLYDFAEYSSISFDLYSSRSGREVWIAGEFTDEN